MADVIRVLLVDDDPSVQALFSAFFQEVEGMELVGGATDGVAGLAAIEQWQPHVVLLDLVMPRLSGIGVLEALSQQKGDRPLFLVISRVNTHKVIDLALDLGASFYLLKPVHLGELPALIRRLLDTSSPTHGAAHLLQSMGANPATTGFRLTCTAAHTLAQHPQGDCQLKEAYYAAAQEDNTSYQCVEKNIRVLVGQLHANNTPAWQQFWGTLPVKKPSNGTFLRQLAKQIQNKSMITSS